MEAEHLKGFRMNIDKAYVSQFKLTKSPKDLKHRKVICYPTVERLYFKTKNVYMKSESDKIFSMQHSAVNQMLAKACKELEIDEINCHDFRHTFISNCISKGVRLPVIAKVSGDTQETILKRYSHMFESDEFMILEALKNL